MTPRAAALWILILSSSAYAAPTPHAIGTRISPRGIDFLQTKIARSVPPQLALPPLSSQLYNCPFTDNDPTLYVSNGVANVVVHRVDLIPSSAQLQARINMDLSVDADVRVTKPYACFGEANCQIHAAAQNLGIGATVNITNVNGKVNVDLAAIDLSLSADMFQLDSSGCLLGDFVELVIDLFKGWILDALEPRLETMLRNQLAPMLSDAVAGFMAQSGTILDFNYAIAIEDIGVSTSGITLEASGDVSATTTAACIPNVPEPAAGSPGSPNLGTRDDHLTLALAIDLVNDGLDAAWRAGLLCLNKSTLGALFKNGDPTVMLAAMMELPIGTSIDFDLHTATPPTLALAAKSGVMTMALSGLDLKLDFNYPDGTTGHLEMETDIAADVQMNVDPSTNAFAFAIQDMRVARLDVRGTNGVILTMDPARIEQALHDLLLPQLADKLATLPLSSPVLHSDASPLLADTWLVVNDVGADTHYAYVYADLFETPISDNVAPDTRFDGTPPALTHPGATQFLLAGTDDQTPGRLVRFKHRFDGGAWSDPSFSRGLWAPATDGMHRVEVAAVDLNGNVDPTPAVHTFEVDAVPPTIQFTKKPAEVERTRQIEVAFTGSDDRTAPEALGFRWRLRKVDESTGQTQTVREQDFTPGAERFSLEVPDDGSYSLEVAVRDEAGNQTSVQARFAVMDDGGCAAAPGSVRGSGVLVLALFALLFLRRKAVVVAALLAFSIPARAANELGNLMAGPTDAGAASSFLNPASFAQVHGTRLWIDGGLTWIAGTYQRDGVDAATGQAWPTAELGVPKPQFAAAFSNDSLDRRLHLGVGVTVPFIDGADWSVAGTMRSPTTYHADYARIYSIYATPFAALELHPAVRIGAGLNVIHTRLTKRFDKDMGATMNQLAGTNAIAPEDPAFAAPASIEGSGTSFGAVLGIEFQPTRWLRYGASWVSGSSSSMDATLQVQNAPVMDALRQELHSRQLALSLTGTGTVEWGIPQVVNAGVAVLPRENLELAADLQWTDMASVGVVDTRFAMRSSTLIPEAMVSTKLRVNDWRVSGRGIFGIREDLRGVVRVAWDGSSVPDQLVNPNNLDFDVVSLGGGAEWTLSPRVRVMIDYTHFFVIDRDVTKSHYVESPDAVDAFNLPPGTGRYSFEADRVGLSLAWLL
jgi:long-subunit fatty acid transport protein